MITTPLHFHPFHPRQRLRPIPTQSPIVTSRLQILDPCSLKARSTAQTSRHLCRTRVYPSFQGVQVWGIVERLLRRGRGIGIGIGLPNVLIRNICALSSWTLCALHGAHVLWVTYLCVVFFFICAKREVKGRSNAFESIASFQPCDTLYRGIWMERLLLLQSVLFQGDELVSARFLTTTFCWYTVKCGLQERTW